jgi:hypothetical protein
MKKESKAQESPRRIAKKTRKLENFREQRLKWVTGRFGLFGTFPFWGFTILHDRLCWLGGFGEIAMHIII